MAAQEQTRQVGDTRTAIAATLTQNGSAVNLTGLTTKFTMVKSEGGVKVAETEDNVSVTDAAAGEIQYSPQAADVDAAGTFHAYFIAEVTATGAQDTFPAKTGDFQIIIEPLVR